MASNQLEAEAAESYQEDESFSKVAVMKLTRTASVRFKRNLLRKLSGGTDNKKQLKKSRSVKISSLGSSRSSNKQTNLHQPAKTSSRESSGRVLKRTPTLRVLKSKNSSTQKATCSSTLKGSKFPDDLETQPGESRSEVATIAKVCTYSYCSLHGHRHASPPSLKRLISVRRRALKNQRGLTPEAQPSAKGKKPGLKYKETQPGNMNFISMEEGGDDAISNLHDTESCSFSSGSVEPPEVLSDSSSVDGEVVQPAASDEEKTEALETNHNLAASDEIKNEALETNHVLAAGSNSGTRKFRLGNGKNFKLWNLLYQHMVTGRSAEAERQPPVDGFQDTSELGSSQNLSGNDHALKVKACIARDQKLESAQSDAVKLVQQAINKLLSEIPDEASDGHSIASDENILVEEKNEDKEASHEEPQDLGQDKHRAELPVKQEPEKQMPKRWSNLKKLIILRRFVKELGSVSNFHRHKGRNQPMQHGPETERVHLRHQTVEGRKNANEWMLDYALRQVISTLAPSQKRKVDLLVQAFETVVPGMNISKLSLAGSPQRGSVESTESSIPNANEGTKVNPLESMIRKTEAPEEPCDTGSILKDEAECISSEQIPENLTLTKAFESGISTSVSEVHSSSSGLNNSQDCKNSPNEAEEEQGEPENQVETISGNDKSEHYFCQSPPPAKNSELNATASLAEGNKLEKQRYSRLWYLLYKHMVSTSPEDRSLQPLGEEAKQEEGGDGIRSVQKEGNDDTIISSSTADHDTMLKIHRIDHHNTELQNEVIKLVEEAIDEIPLSDDHEAPEKEPSEKNRIEGEEQFIPEAVPQIAIKDVPEEPNKRQDQDGLNTAVLGSGNNDTREHETGVSNVANKYKSQGQKNWSNLKKLILIRRFVKSMEKVKAFNPRGPRFLPQGNAPEPEKVHLRHLGMEDRKNSDEWMLDYALQQVVTELTPARKRRVKLLVEAFETVVPTLSN